ncbi:MAG TPA: hypothetical protein VIN04_13870, partial [Myxococcota bacterium]
MEAPGPRAAEARLVEEVLAAHAARVARLRSGDLAALRAPLRVVVPSRSLREHLATQLVRAAGRSLVGVAVQTHTALALETLARAGRSAPRGAALVPVLVRRHAAREPALADWLDGLDDGYGVVEASVRDLLDAGFADWVAEPFAEAIDELAAAGALDRAVAARARAVGAVAKATLASLAEAGLGHRSALLVEAREALQASPDPGALLPTAGLWLHGYADVTGLAGDWLEALVRAFGGCVLVDVPPDPADPERREERYSERFRDRFRALVSRVETAPLAPAPAISLLHAPGTEAELRAVAARVRALLDEGAPPETIGVVAPRLDAVRGALEAQLGRLGIPFSVTGVGAGPGPTARRVAALLELLADGPRTTIDTWLAAHGGREGADADLRIALHVLGAGRLEGLAQLDLGARLGPDAASLPLPVRRGGPPAGDGAADGEEEEANGEPAAAERARSTSRRRHVARARLEAVRARAAELVRELAEWPDVARFADHAERLRTLVERRLGWRLERFDRSGRPGRSECAPLLEALASLANELPADLPLARDELVPVVAAALEDAAEGRLGGEGAGVQVLTVTAARGRCFAHLFLIGLNRDALPRAPVDDPVLPDAVRERLST